ncbi:hypothetical protein BJY04DRAFT_218855 [Aspergillus karnatakaensis]|uniref:RING-H2 finger protein n=1 Tax=Aspergillus karnatakaensis TaxID=1810916 RepID=UPI003CCD4268
MPFLSLHPSSSSSPLFRYLSLFLLSLCSTVLPAASSLLPSNNTADLPTERYQLAGTQVDLARPFDIAPVSQFLVSLRSRQLKEFNLTGPLVQVGSSNLLSLQESDIAFVSCDSAAYTGNLDALATLTQVLTRQQKPQAVLLYSTTASHCEFLNDDYGYEHLFTSLSADTARTVEARLQSNNETGSAYIVPDMTTFTPTGTFGGGGDGDGGGADSPNTAMIILYSITGIITALFLTIIVTGAVRAHRHPERYGPRQRPGRPRQSRARGIARAMLETIPIVKFGDNNDGKVDSDKGDVEMSIASEVPASPLREDQDTTRQPPMATGGSSSPAPEETRDTTTTAAAADATATPKSNTETKTGATDADHPNFSCPICTDDFVKGQDLRVLPCNHQFHPECIDPWLVNVSGTCPLCRIDLNPPQAETDPENPSETNPEDPENPNNTTTAATTQATEDQPTHRHRRISSYLHGPLNARRMRDASVEERLAALRSVREEANREAENESDEQRSRRNRLTARFKEKFRIRTRAHGGGSAEEANTPSSSSS